MHRGIQVLLVGPYQLYLDCLAAAFLAAGRFGTVFKASQPEEVLQKLSEDPPDLLVIDVTISTLVGVGWIEYLANLASSTRILILGSRADEKELVDWIVTGAEGIYYKDNSLSDLLAGVERMMEGEALYPAQLVPYLCSRLGSNSNGADSAESNGGTSLTQREREIHALLLECLSNKQIASQLHLSRHTVKNHVHNILKKRGVADRLELIKQAQQKT